MLVFPHNQISDIKKGKLQEKNFYKERCAECLRALLAWNYSIELIDRDAADRAAQSHTSSGSSSKLVNG